MFRVTLAAIALVAIYALDAGRDGNARAMLRADNQDMQSKAGTPTRAEEIAELRKDLDEVKKLYDKKEKEEKARDQATQARRERLKKRIDAFEAKEKQEAKLTACIRKAMREEIKSLREQLETNKDGDDEQLDKAIKECEEKHPQIETAPSPTGQTEAQSEAQSLDDHLKVPDEVPDIPDAPEAPDVFPVPTSSRCVVIICCQYMIIYTALAVLRTVQEFAGTAGGRLEEGLKAAVQTMAYGPMLCVLFIACRMRVEFLSDGKGQPQMWVQNCMYALTFAVLANTLLVLVVPFVTGKPLALTNGSCDLERPSMLESDSKVAFYILTAARYLILLGLYGGIAGIIIGTCTYMPPGATDLAKLPAPAPAVMCTMIMVVMFFVMQLVLAVCRTYTEFKGEELPRIVGAMNGGATAMEFAPMLAILFLAARMRALQHDDQPQAWAQKCMYGATISMCITAVLAVVVPGVLGGTVTVNPQTREVTFEVQESRKAIGFGLLALRFLCMFGFYCGAVGVACSIYMYEAPGGAAATLPVSPTVQCVVNLTCQFFFIYLLITLMLTVTEISGGKISLNDNRFYRALEAAKNTVAFAPMLSILFVTTRMYALLITNKRGAPQAWVQDGMYMATWSLLISFVSCLATGLLVGKIETDRDGNVVSKFDNKFVGIVMNIVRYLTMLLLYGGMVTVIVGLFVMTPETANGRGSVPYVTDAVDATPVGKPPPQPTDPVEAGKDLGKQMG